MYQSQNTSQMKSYSLERLTPSSKLSRFVVTSRQSVLNFEIIHLSSSSSLSLLGSAASSLTVLPEYHDEKSVQTVTENAVVYIPLAEMIDFEKELARLEGEKKNTLFEIERLEKKLSNEGFVAKAPAQVVEGEKAKLTKYRDTLEKIMSAIEKFKN